MEFKKKSKISTEIPTASMPDIVFMLLLFFMVATVFRQYQGLPIELPTAKKIVKLEAKKNVTSIYANAAGEISIDDKIINRIRDIRNIMYKKRVENPRTMVSLKADRGAPMKVITDIQQELREADVLPINYTAKFGD
jgi:biopolymer transport protein ExbD